MDEVVGLFYYPIKSCSGFKINEMTITSRGPLNDRRWVIVNADNVFLTQREIPELALIQPIITESQISLSFENQKASADLQSENTKIEKVQVWKDHCDAISESPILNEFLSSCLKQKVRLMRQSQNDQRLSDSTYGKARPISFADGFPILIINQTSIDDLNTHLEVPVDTWRFRPNILVKTQNPFEEDNWSRFQIGDTLLERVKPCARCVIINIDQELGRLSPVQPLKALAKYRLKDKKIFFGQNISILKTGTLRLGQKIIHNPM